MDRERPGGIQLPHLILGLVIVVELTLTAGASWHWWRHRRGPERPATLAGEGLFIRGDGLGNYAWLRSLMIDGDWSFDNEFDEHNPLADEVPAPANRTPLGRRANPWPMGAGFVWGLTVVPAHVLLLELRQLGLPVSADGYSWPYQIIIAVNTLGASVLGLLLLYRIGCRYARPVRAALAAAFLVLGTTIVYYSAGEVSMSHGLGTALAALVVWYWLHTYGSESPGRWLLLGLLLGLTATVRYQLVGLALLPAGECLGRWLSEGWAGRWTWPWRAVFRLGLAAGATVLAFVPQMVAWRLVYGQWLVAPVPLARSWLSPNWYRVLLSTDRGLVYWTPLVLLAVAGGLWHLLSRRSGKDILRFPALRQPVLILLAAFVWQVYALASISGPGVFLGCGYGYRHLTEPLVLLLPGLAVLLEQASPRGFRWLCVAGWLLVLWNLNLIGQFCFHLLPRNAGAEPLVLLAGAIRLAWLLPLAAVAGGAGMAGILAWLFWTPIPIEPASAAVNQRVPRQRAG